MNNLSSENIANFTRITITCYLIILTICFIPRTSCVKKQFFSFEHPEVTTCHPDYCHNLVIKSWRKNRKNPIHYVDLNVTILKPYDSKFRMTFSFYQLLSNVYKPSFVEINMTLCDMIEKDILVAPAFVAAFRRIPKELRPIPDFRCPLLPGFYYFTNMIVPLENIPKSFPFKNGRLYGTLTLNKIQVGSGHIDFQLKTIDD